LILLFQLEFLLVALQRELLQDYRADLDKRPLFKQGLTRLDDLSIGDVVTGQWVQQDQLEVITYCNYSEMQVL